MLKEKGYVNSMKYFGIILDEHLTFDEHIVYIMNKASKKLGVLRRARVSKPENKNIAK